jgi:hypothetical protein
MTGAAETEKTKGEKKGSNARPAESHSPAVRLGIDFRPSLIGKELRRRLKRVRISAAAQRFLAATMHGIAADLVHNSVDAMIARKGTRLTSDHLERAIHQDADAQAAFGHIRVAGARRTTAQVDRERLKRLRDAAGQIL